jgi:glutamate/aspartate transport system substrate-binding protein
MKLHTAFAAVLIGMGISVAPACAEDPAGTLAKIKKNGSITLGVRDGSVPFSYLDGKQQYIGYSVDLCMKVVAALRTELAMTDLKVVMNPVTAANRISLMANGTIDLECGATTNNLKRQPSISLLRI